ncbi:MAG TPA: hypothetical protein PLF81_00905 [Candidatus Anammoximicrobium sp.]|nr:hypothetical protein [Candidatus Anammoximicrobium sp.]
MKIKFSCIHCGQQYTAEPDAAGKQFICKKCGKPVHVPHKPVEDSDSPIDLRAAAVLAACSNGSERKPALTPSTPAAVRPMKALQPSVQRRQDTPRTSVEISCPACGSLLLVPDWACVDGATCPGTLAAIINDRSEQETIRITALRCFAKLGKVDWDYVQAFRDDPQLGKEAAWLLDKAGIPVTRQRDELRGQGPEKTAGTGDPPGTQGRGTPATGAAADGRTAEPGDGNQNVRGDAKLRKREVAPDSPEYPVAELVWRLGVDGDASGLTPLISPTATGYLADMRNGKLSERQIADVKKAMTGLEKIGTTKIVGPLRQIVLQNHQGQMLQFLCTRNGKQYQIERLLVRNGKSSVPRR